MLTMLPLTNAGTRLMNDGCPPESIKWTKVFFLFFLFFEMSGLVTSLLTTSEAMPSTLGGTGRGTASSTLSAGDGLETSGVAGDGTGGV